MNSTDIKDYKASLIASKQERPKSCEELFERWKKEMEFPREEDFSRDETVAAAVEKLQKKQLQDFYEEFISNSGKSVRRLSVLIYGKKHVYLMPNGMGGSGDDSDGRAEIKKSLPKKGQAVVHSKTEIISNVEKFRENMKGKVWHIMKKSDKCKT